MTRALEGLVVQDQKYRIDACLRHNLRAVAGGWTCQNEECREQALDADGLPRFDEDGKAVMVPRVWKQPPLHSSDGIKQLLDSVEWSLKQTKLLREAGNRLAEKGVQSYVWDSRRGVLSIEAGRNLIVINGRRTSGRRTFLISGDTPPAQVQYTGLDNNTANPTEATTQFDTTSSNRSFKAFDSGFATVTGAGVSPVIVLTQSTWTEADNPGPKTFVVRRIGLANANTNATDTLYSILGGTTPVSILSLDFTGLTTFTVRFQVQVTLTNQSAQ